MVIGPRIWKTGVAVALCMFLIQLLNLDSPLLAVVAAIITIQPSISKSIVQGTNRALATIIGGIIGFIMVYLFGAHFIIVGLAVILAITVSIKFKLLDGIVITAITVVAVMVDVTGEPIFYALNRLIETLIGIGVGVAVNLIVSPPNSEQSLVLSLDNVNQRLKRLFVAVVNGFINAQGYEQNKIDQDIDEIRNNLEEIRRKLFEFKDELGYRKMIKNYQVKKYETIVSSYNLIFERIMGIYHTELDRHQRNLLNEESNQEYKDIIATLEKLLTTIVSMQDNLLCYLTSKNQDLCLYLEKCAVQNEYLVKELRKKINTWHLQEENKNKALSLLEISSVGYEMVQISSYLKRISEALKDLIKQEEQETVINRKFFRWFYNRAGKKA
jgi:uncharacterized membrane protein YgaE (UPF0421/DUF939 family)